MRGQPLPFPAPAIASISNSAVDLNRELGRAEGEVNKYWAAEYLRQRGSQGWPALVLGWFKAELNLIAVSLEDLGLEAIVKVGAHSSRLWRVVDSVAHGPSQTCARAGCLCCRMVRCQGFGACA